MISSFRQEEIFPSSIDRPLVENTPPPVSTPPPSAPIPTKKKAKTAAPVATPSSFKPVRQPYEDPAPVVPKVELDPQRTTSSLFSDYVGTQQSRPSAPSLFKPPEQESTGSALGNYKGFFNQTQQQSQALAEMAKESKDYSGLKNADVNKLNRNVSQGLDDYSTKEVDENILTYIKDNNIPPFIETEDGEKLFFTTGTDTSMPDLAALGDAHRENGRYVATGDVGTYSSIWIENPSTSEEILNNPVLSVAAMFVPYGTAALTALKGATGQTLHGSDWASLASAGLQKAGYTKAPSTVDGVKDAGKGLTLGGIELSYNQTNALLKGAITGDPKEALAETLTSKYLEGALDNKDSVMANTLDSLEMDKDAFINAFSNTVGKVADGKDLDDAVLSGFAQYIREDGTFEGNILPDWLKEAGRDFDDAFLQPIKEAVEMLAGGAIDGMQEIGHILGEVGSTVESLVRPVVDVVEDVASGIGDLGSEFDDAVLHPLEETIEEFGEPIEDAVREAGGVLADTMAPVKEFLEEVGPDIEDTIREGGRAFDDYILQPLKNLLEGILDNVSLGGVGAGGAGGGALLSAGTGTGSDDLFKFKTQVGVELPEFAEVEYRDPFESSFQSTIA
jgi:hypothetical protein